MAGRRVEEAAPGEAAARDTSPRDTAPGESNASQAASPVRRLRRRRCRTLGRKAAAMRLRGMGREQQQRSPVGAIVLIGLGVLFLLSNMVYSTFSDQTVLAGDFDRGWFVDVREAPTRHAVGVRGTKAQGEEANGEPLSLGAMVWGHPRDQRGNGLEGLQRIAYRVLGRRGWVAKLVITLRYIGERCTPTPACGARRSRGRREIRRRIDCQLQGFKTAATIRARTI